jgi:hypothetical protein
LPDGTPPRLGYPAGLIAAQSLGERCSQLSMQAFHTGKRGIDIAKVKAQLNPEPQSDCWRLVKSDSGFGDFITGLRQGDALGRVDKRHFELIWRVMHESADKTVLSAMEANQSADLFLGLIRSRNQWDFVRQAVRERIDSDGSADWARILTGRGRRNVSDDYVV